MTRVSGDHGILDTGPSSRDAARFDPPRPAFAPVVEPAAAPARPARDRRLTWIGTSGVGLLLLALLMVVTIQVAFGAYQNGVWDNPDEAGHFVSGLMVRDYLVHGFAQGPVTFAREYYAHYPKVAIGNWPPAFPAIQGAWMLLVPAGRVASLALIALMAGTVSWVAYRLLRPSVTPALALVGATLWMLLPPVPYFVTHVMAEVPVTLGVMLAIWAWHRYLVSRRVRDLALFAALAVLAAMTKSNGLFVFLVPPIAVIIGARWWVLRARVVWATIAVSACVVIPWVLYFLPVMRSGWSRPNAWLPPVAGLDFYPTALLGALGGATLALIAIGLVTRLRTRADRRSVEGTLWVTALSAIIAGIGFHAAVPGGLYDLRHLTTIYPFLAMFAVAGAQALADALRRIGARERVALASAVGMTVALVLIGAMGTQRAPDVAGFDRVAALLVPGDTPHRPRTTLVTSDAVGEGAFVVAMALRDQQRPGHTVWRATKLLASMTWAGGEYVLRVDSDTALLALLARAGVETIVIDRSIDLWPHQRLLEGVIERSPERFTLQGTVAIDRGTTRTPDGLAIYSMTHAGGARPATLRQIPGYASVLEVAAPVRELPQQP